MIAGIVFPNGEAVITLQLRGRQGREKHVQAVVDTGFNDHLTLPRSIVERLNLRFREGVFCTLADGSQAMARVFTVDVYWLGGWRRTFALEMEGGALIGMALLKGCHLEIDAEDKGRVEIRPLENRG